MYVALPCSLILKFFVRYVKSDSMHYGEEHGVVEKDLPNLVSMGTDSDASSVCSIAKIQHEQVITHYLKSIT